ncbi:MAG: hypothetical protein JJV90_01235 [Spiroplasma sp.]|nr:hypothetical protein [Mycoplasmatales bacterium]
MKCRGFEQIKDSKLGIIPKRATAKSAGYDFHTIEDLIIAPGETVLAKTGIKAYMLDDEVLKVFVRSSLGFKKHLRLANSVGIIDADYYGNADNDGHIMIALHNFGTNVQNIEAQERIAQGIFVKYLIIDSDQAKGERDGGFGSTK